jgi:RNA polymerase sigma-70 factor, ECF subfamily
MVALNERTPLASSLDAASAESFGAMVDPHRRELLVHCYRMLGSIDDAEDAVQEAMANAWRGRATYQRDISFRAWLYRIATNACLDAISRRKRGRASEESLGVGPYPDELLGGVSAGPEARYDQRESISLAFLTVLQVLPPRQRAVLILRDVLSWHAAEVAVLLDLSVPAVNSALQRARGTVAERYRPRPRIADGAGATSGPDAGPLRALLDRYVRAWEAADIPGLVALLRDDAVLSMPPGAAVTGATAIGAFLAATVLARGGRRRLVPTRANGGPAFIVYGPGTADAARTAAASGSAPIRALAVALLQADGQRVARIDAFFDPRLFARFGAPDELAG